MTLNKKTMPQYFYLHGFASSPQSVKAKSLSDRRWYKPLRR
ncbi:YqiA/YcfP family alpha/beta fold hydrolase [Leptolyngbyaceae cyanobacterium UHCC 1019]